MKAALTWLGSDWRLAIVVAAAFFTAFLAGTAIQPFAEMLSAEMRLRSSIQTVTSDPAPNHERIAEESRQRQGASQGLVGGAR